MDAVLSMMAGLDVKERSLFQRSFSRLMHYFRWQEHPEMMPEIVMVCENAKETPTEEYKAFVMDTFLQKQTRRAEHALKRIKEKGWYTTDFSDIMVLECLGERMGDFAVANRVHHFLGILDLGTAFGSGVFRITDIDWMQAAELTVAIHDWNTYLDEDALWGTALSRHPDTLVCCLVVIAVVNSLRDLRSSDEVRSLLHTMLSECEERQRAEDKLSLSNMKSEKLRETLQKKEAAEAELRRKTDKTIRGMERQMRELQRENEILRMMQTSDDADPDSAELPEQEVMDAAEDDSLPELPRENVCFIGGYPNLFTRLQEKYPDWTYIDTKNVTAELPTGTRIVFVWYRRISHRLFWRIRSSMTKNMRLIYLDHNGHESLEWEMRSKYAEFLEDAD